MQPKHYSTDFSSSRPNSRRQVRKQNKTSPGAPNRKNICINYSKQNWNLGRLRKKTKQNGQCQGSSGVKIGVVSSTCTSTFPTNKPCTSSSCTVRQFDKCLGHYFYFYFPNEQTYFYFYFQFRMRHRCLSNKPCTSSSCTVRRFDKKTNM